MTATSLTCGGVSGGCTLTGKNVSLSGLTRLHLGFTAAAEETASIEAVIVGKAAALRVTATDVLIGSPVRPSKLRFTDVDATGSVVLTNVRASFHSSIIETTGTDVRFLDSRFTGREERNSPDPYLVVTAGVGSTCDFSSSTFKKLDLQASCDTVIGP